MCIVVAFFIGIILGKLLTVLLSELDTHSKLPEPTFYMPMPVSPPKPPPPKPLHYNHSDYVDSKISELVARLQCQDVLSKDFTFLTKQERERQLEKFINDFLGE